jgi:hypothetical protein
MHDALRFPLSKVLDLAEHAVTGPTTADPVGDEPAGPALLLVARARLAWYSPPGPVTARHGWGRSTPPAANSLCASALPLHEPARQPLIDQLRDAATDTVTVHLHPGHLTVGVTRRR